MEVFYINIEEFKKKFSKTILEQYADFEIKNEKRFFEYTVGRFLVKNVAKERFNIQDSKIILNNNKPIFKNAKLHFNISHSKDIVIACFDNNPCGVDIEFIKEKKLDSFSKYFKQDFKTQEDFYKFWTYKEASYKLGCEVKDSHFTRFLDNYYLTIVSDKNIKKNLLIINYMNL